MKQRVEELNMTLSDPEVWGDPDKMNKLNAELKGCTTKLEILDDLETKLDDVATLISFYEEVEDEDSLNEAEQELLAAEVELETLRLETLLDGPYDKNNAVISLHAGAGGTEACDWTSMLLRMYTRWAENKGFKVTTLDFLDGDEAGVKSVTLKIEGEYAYGYLKAERGIHRLVRISPFDAAKKRHTSFASADVMPELNDEINIEIRPEDLRVDTYRSSGAGGQHVNKTESAIRITHLPTGIVVQCQNERSQIQNRETAMNMLRGKLMALKEQEEMDKLSDIKGEVKKIEWGSQIRSYVFCPYTMVNDHRTEIKTPNVQAVMDGEIDLFIVGYLKALNS
ncbi:MAG: peptide chain release factor 2 [Clostridiales bacterium]|nr:peptide chain release factor 2 [Clostridiales bacterium]